jgi:RNA polymerase sigma factor (sigma-70 family)
MPLDRYNYVAEHIPRLISSDAPRHNSNALSEDRPNALVDTIEVHNDVNGQFLVSSFQDGVREVIASLPERQAFVLKQRFGFDDGTPKTLKEVGSMLGITRERVRQLELKAMKQIQYSVSENSGMYELLKYMRDFEETHINDVVGSR